MPQIDRANPTPAEVYYAARRAAEQLPATEREELLGLIRRTHKDRKAHHQVLKRFQNYPGLRSWLDKALFLSDRTKGFAQLSGDLTPIPARSLWVCPQCGFQWRVLRKGRPVPPCPRDGSELVMAEKEA